MWSAFIALVFVGVDYASAHIYGHRHIHRSNGYNLPADVLEPRDLNQFDAIHMPTDPSIEFRTLTTTVYADCVELATTSAFLRKILDVPVREPTQAKSEYSQVMAHWSKSSAFEPTPNVLTTITEIDVVTEAGISTRKSQSTSFPTLESNTASTGTRVPKPLIMHGTARPTSNTNRTESPSHLASVNGGTASTSTRRLSHSINHGIAQPTAITSTHTSASATHLSPTKTRSSTSRTAIKTGSHTTIGSIKHDAQRPVSNKTRTESSPHSKTGATGGKSITGTKIPGHPTKHGIERPVPTTTNREPASGIEPNSAKTHTSITSRPTEMGTASFIPPIHHFEDRPVSETTHTKPEPGLLGLPRLPDILPATAVLEIPSEIGEALDPQNSPLPDDMQWTSIPKDGAFSTDGFGGRTLPKGTEIGYKGNVGIPWGSNIIAVSPTEAHRYKYVVQFSGPKFEPWTVLLWNKIGPDDKIDGWYGHSALEFVLAPGETEYVAFDEDSIGGWGAAPGNSIPIDQFGGYTSTWGEFSFGDKENKGWSGWDVSAIQAQIAHQDVQGMRICQADGMGCSIITPQAKNVVNAYTESQRHEDGIGGASSPGPVRLVAQLDYQE
ncbi:hypothetical protein N7495_008656 [Penicillium taxi]|uniref:uncharacterized protein n=1 Tax=Penicillium taxi TaxID=168475 RepID=UPI0025454495|nr:uncharacterized protein N7495_008656 [Penicillium taxi]KAJ5888615.1 hypothetical protein N7495_008656 [Penicillium taxi]